MKDRLYRLALRHDCMEYNTNDQFSLADDLLLIARDLMAENSRIQSLAYIPDAAQPKWDECRIHPECSTPPSCEVCDFKHRDDWCVFRDMRENAQRLRDERDKAQTDCAELKTQLDAERCQLATECDKMAQEVFEYQERIIGWQQKYEIVRKQKSEMYDELANLSRIASNQEDIIRDFHQVSHGIDKGDVVLCRAKYETDPDTVDACASAAKDARDLKRGRTGE
jgi:hypothetical protein